MQKWRCIPCDYIYDPEQGDEEGGIPPVPLSRICRRIGNAPSAAWARMNLKRKSKNH